MITDRGALDKIEGCASSTKPISIGLPAAQAGFAGHWRNVYTLRLGGTYYYSSSN